MDLQNSPLLTDFYQLTMLDVYYRRQMNETAVFEFFVRRLPKERNFLVAAGLEQALQFLESLRFSDQEIDWLKQNGEFSQQFLNGIRDLRFSGDVHAMPEGSIFFPHEPILRITAPLPEAQLVESRLINLLHFQTLIASKAARCVLTAPTKTLVDFGMRRAHGSEAALLAARANYLAGFSGTATVLSGAEFDIPLYGTMAHSFIQANENEPQAFEDFARAYPGNAVLLIDTYDTAAGARKVAQLASELAPEGLSIKAVRIDSGDLASDSRKVRRILDRAGHKTIGIFVSGNLDEHRIAELIAKDAPIDGLGVGTSLDISSDAPSLDCVYKLQEYAGRPRRKRSAGKATWPGRKQVFRTLESGVMVGDIVCNEKEIQSGTPMLIPVMRNGARIAEAESLQTIRQRVAQSLDTLPEALKSLMTAPAYPVVISDALQALAAEVDEATA